MLICAEIEAFVSALLRTYALVFRDGKTPNGKSFIRLSNILRIAIILFSV